MGAIAYAYLQELRAPRLAAQLDNAAVLALFERILLPALRRPTCGWTASRPVPISEVRVLEIRAAHRSTEAVQSLRRQVALPAAPLGAAMSVCRRLMLGAGLLVAGAVRPVLISAMHRAGAGRQVWLV